MRTTTEIGIEKLNKRNTQKTTTDILQQNKKKKKRLNSSSAHKNTKRTWQQNSIGGFATNEKRENGGTSSIFKFHLKMSQN